MTYSRVLRWRYWSLCVLSVGFLLVLPLRSQGQQGGQRGAGAGGRGGQAPAAPTGRGAAPIDLTGYWVALITDDWQFRMVTPPKGDYRFIPLNPQARQVADMWDPAKDETAGEQCRGYGAGAIMRVPTRLNITWENDTTLRIETDAGTQTRVLRFGASQPPAGEPTWQGYSVAEWALPGGGRGGRGRGAAPSPARTGQLRVVTTRMRPGYIRKNGVPYSANAVMTEYFNLLREADGNQYLSVTEMLEDPQYLTQPFVRTPMFKKLPDAAGWNPTPCSAR